MISLLVLFSFLNPQTVYAASAETCPQILQKDSICKLSKGDFACRNRLEFDCVQAPANIRLLGKGVVNQETQASITLACFDSTCLNLRYLYSMEGKNYFFGPTYAVPFGKNSTEADLDTIRSEMLRILKTLRIYNWRTLGTGEKMHNVFSDRDGWNWSNHPVDRQSDRFNRILFTLDGYHETVLVDRIAQKAVKKICSLKEAVGGFDHRAGSWLNLVIGNRGNAQMYFPSLIMIPGQFVASLEDEALHEFFKEDNGEPCPDQR
jgi:hypothetical protein